jgi:acetyl-CoA carboxylase biotin carboxyl carrier protein
MAKENADSKRIKELIEIMKQNDLLELEVKHGDDKILLKRWPPQPALGPAVVPVVGPGIPTAPAGQNAAQNSATESSPTAPQLQQDLVEIKSPIVGTFYDKPSPDSESYVELDSHVSPQTVVCIVEAMKVMNEIKAENEGTIVEVLVTNGQAVEYGQVLFRVKPE